MKYDHSKLTARTEDAIERAILVTVLNAQEAWPLVYNHEDKADSEERGQHKDDDKMEGMRTHAATRPQVLDDWLTGDDSSRHREQAKTEPNDLTGEVIYFRVWAAEQTCQRLPSKGIQ